MLEQASECIDILLTSAFLFLAARLENLVFYSCLIGRIVEMLRALRIFHASVRQIRVRIVSNSFKYFSNTCECMV